MTEKHQHTDQQDYTIGEFKVSKLAVENSTIGGPEDIYDLLTAHWKTVVFVVFLFVVTTYQGRSNILEDQVGSIRSIYAGLPEEKGLAVDALRSLWDLRDALTLIVEERTVALIETEGLLRGGSKSERRVEDLMEISSGFRKLWVDEEEVPPSIYQVVDSLSDVLNRGESSGELAEISKDSSTAAYGVARYLLAHVSARGADLSSAVFYLRDAEGALSPSSVVRGDLIRFELALGSSALIQGEQDRLISIYRQWWPQWVALLNRDESTATAYRVANGMARSLVFPLYALSQEGERQALTVSEFEKAIGYPLAGAVRIGLLKVREAEELGVDRLPTLINAAKLDIVVGKLLSNESIEVKERLRIWDLYQSITEQFRGVSLDLAKQTLFDRAFGLMSEASNVATSHGERLEFGDLVIKDAVVNELPEKYRLELGLVEESVE
ncbi:MAG: hypothetical protein HOI66_01585 [Verrucomicrobia bacterium]|nr:hypothetical protein [Verrucomicrobiota bacterium]